VIMLSPKNNATPEDTEPTSTSLVRLPDTVGAGSEFDEGRIPPSPSLSARITATRTFTVTISVTDQRRSGDNAVGGTDGSRWLGSYGS